MNGRVWTADEDATLRINFAGWPTFLIAHLLDRSIYATRMRAHSLGLKKGAEFYTNPHAHKWNGTNHPNSINSRFKPGTAPPNKGMRRPGWSPGRMATTQFKKGSRCGQAARNWMPIGTVVVDGYGYLKRKVRDDAPPNRGQLNWEFLHVMLWEEHLGPVPPRHNIIFKNGNKTDIRIDNLACISKAENMRRNSYHTRYPKEIGHLIQARGALVRAINRRTRIDRGEITRKQA